ncbi:MAG TPA: tetratricopeptide repeat protein [Syntrophobacteria bacterium]|nr:tetratricopeptide repeat protein [Syntrophobacteria bacterium]
MRAWHRSPGCWPGLYLALAFLISVIGCAGDRAERKKNAERMMNEGSLALRAGDSTLAIDLLLKAEKEDPDNPYIHYNLGIAYLGKDLLDKAEQQFKEAIRLKSDYSEAYNYLGRMYLYRGQTDAAIQCFQKALNNVLYNNPEKAYYNLGEAYMMKKDYAKAADQLERAVKVVPDYAPAYALLGQAYEGLRKDGDAKRSYRSALQYGGNYGPEFQAQTQLSLGKVLARTGERAEARKSLAEAIKLAPNSRDAAEAQAVLNSIK